MRNKVVIFVHPWMWASSMFADVRARDLGILSIVTGGEGTRIDPPWLAEHSDYVLDCAGVDQEVERVREFLTMHGLEPVAVINGLDSSLSFADALQVELLGHSLDLRRSQVRLNKFEVNETLRTAQVPHVRSSRIRSVEDLSRVREEVRRFGIPFVAKPAADTAGMAGFEILNSAEELDDYVERYLGRANSYYPDRLVSDIIVQPYISPGRFGEFTVDYVSTDGVHACIGISENRKDDQGVFRSTVTYDTCSSIDFSRPKRYVEACLTALDVQWGFTHNEIFWDMEDEVLLVETNNRYAGQPVSELYKRSYHGSALDSLLCRDDQFVRERTAQREGFCAAVYLYNVSTDHPDALDLGEAAPFATVVDFRGKNKPRIARDFALRYDRAKHIGAILLLEGHDERHVEELVEGMVSRDRQGLVFRAGTSV